MTIIDLQILIANYNTGINKLTALAKSIEDVLPTVVSGAQISSDLVLAGETIDRGRIARLNATYNNMLSNIELLIDTYQKNIIDLSAEVNALMIAENK